VDRSLFGSFLFGPPEAGSKVGTASRPDTIRCVAARRGGQGWPEATAQRRTPRACVLDGSEHRGTSLAASGGLRGPSAPLAPSLGALGVPFRVKPCPPGYLDGLELLQFGFCQLRQAS